MLCPFLFSNICIVQTVIKNNIYFSKVSQYLVGSEFYFESLNIHSQKVTLEFQIMSVLTVDCIRLGNLLSLYYSNLKYSLFIFLPILTAVAPIKCSCQKKVVLLGFSTTDIQLKCCHQYIWNFSILK